jgi:large subunit ribosomal protein L13
MATVHVFEGKGAVVGRLASHVAKLTLKGESAVVLNVEQAVITGDPVMVVKKYAGRRGITNKADPEHAAKWPKRPDYLFKKIVTGMLPKHSARSKAALSLLRAYVSVPKEYAAHSKIDSKTAHKKIAGRFITLQDLCRQL